MRKQYQELPKKKFIKTKYQIIEIWINKHTMLKIKLLKQCHLLTKYLPFLFLTFGYGQHNDKKDLRKVRNDTLSTAELQTD